MPNNAVTKTDFNFAMLVSYSKVSQVGSGAHATCFCHGPHDCFCSVCCTGDESTVALHMNCFLHLSVNTEHEAGQGASPNFQVFGMTQTGIKPSLLVWVARARPTVWISH